MKGTCEKLASLTWLGEQSEASMSQLASAFASV